MYTESFRLCMMVMVAAFITSGCVLGSFYVWKIGLNQVTVVIATITTALTIRLPLHVCQRFNTMESSEVSRKSLTIKAMSQVGIELAGGTMCTIVMICSLSSAKSYLLQVLVKTWAATLLANSINGLILIPALLSCCGPLPSRNKKQAGAVIKET